jgi:MinD-like ATPase involved in chromosome partitioning or flagellar assembly
MAAHDGNPNGHGYLPALPPDIPPAEEDSWHDAPEDEQAGEDEFGAFDELDARYLRTLGTPSFDLGPQTESFVVDLTTPPPVPSRHAADGSALLADATADPLVDPLVHDVLSRSPETTTDEAGPPERPSGAAPTSIPPPLSVHRQPDDSGPAESTPVQPDSAQSGPAESAPVQPDPVQPEPARAERFHADQVRPAHPATPTSAAPAFDIPPVPMGTSVLGAESLTAATVLRHRRPRPQSGWRKGVYSVTGGKVNLGLSRTDRRRADLIERARTPVGGCYRLAVISLKGGVGKTTTTAALGAVFADLRGDRVIALDANPDRGTLAERAPRESGATVRHLLAARENLHRYADVREFTSQSPTRLEVLASDSDPHVSAAFSEQDYRDTVDILERFYNLVLTDCGTGLLHDAMRGILGLANSLVVVSSASLDGARSASATLDWLEAHGFDHLAQNAVVVISSVRPGGGIVDVLQLEDHFASRCRDVVTIPYDPHLESGGVLDLTELEDETADAYRELAAAVGEGFAAP